jgi:methyl halide transferase
MNNEKCCVVSCENPLDQNYWDAQYKAKTTGWDLGEVAPPIKQYIDTITDKNKRILIPGCGNTYEAEYLLKQGFTNITVIDIAPTLVEKLKTKFRDNTAIKILLGDFFEHQGTYDIIIEQTFFCALPPALRQKYVWKMYQLLADNGILTGLLFNRSFEVNPPFGGSKEEYLALFKGAFAIIKMEMAQNSSAPRANSELFFKFKKNNSVTVTLYGFKGTTCSGCMETVTHKFSTLQKVINASMSTDFAEILLVSQGEIPTEELQAINSYDEKYRIKKH